MFAGAIVSQSGPSDMTNGMQIPTLCACMQIYTDVHTQQQMVDKFFWQALSYAHEEHRQLGIVFVESFVTCAQDRGRCNMACPVHQQGTFHFNFTGTH